MSFAILAVQKSTSVDRRFEITLDADRRQEQVIRSVNSGGFAIDWTDVLSIGEPSDPLFAVEARLRNEIESLDFAETMTALIINGRLLASFIQRKHERMVGVNLPPELPLAFAEEAALHRPDDALDFWRRLLGISEEQIEAFRNGLGAFQTEAVAVRGRITETLMRQLVKLHEETIATGLPLQRFIQSAQELMPDASRSVLEGEYRTRLTQAYGGARHELIISRANAFPFTQFFAIIDGRTTWNICYPMGTSGPRGRGYIAASDDPLWFIWRPPNHFGGCRSDLSPIGYRECRRMGILDAQGNKIAVTGSNPNRPFGDPPRFVQDPNSRTIRRVEPQIGFGG